MNASATFAELRRIGKLSHAAILRGEALDLPQRAAGYLRRHLVIPRGPESQTRYGEGAPPSTINALETAAAFLPPATPPQMAGLSDDLQAFVRAEPYMRAGIFNFVRDAASSLDSGATLIDIGAGEAPYREMFGHLRYTTCDWEWSVHSGARRSDRVASVYDLPFEDGSFDAALMTEVMEHLEDPQKALGEVRRVLRHGGRLFLTVPFVCQLHEMPHDHFRFTPPSLRRLLQANGFGDLILGSHGNYFLTLAQLLWDAPGMFDTVSNAEGFDRLAVAHALQQQASLCASLASLDDDPVLPLGFTAVAVAVDRP